MSSFVVPGFSTCSNKLSLQQENLKNSEQNYEIKANPITRHGYLGSDSYTTIIDWMSGVSEQLKLQHSTYYFAVDYFGRYMHVVSRRVSMKSLRILGVTALYAASKMDKIYPPKNYKILQKADLSADANAVFDQERELLQKIQ